MRTSYAGLFSRPIAEPIRPRRVNHSFVLGAATPGASGGLGDPDALPDVDSKGALGGRAGACLLKKISSPSGE